MSVKGKELAQLILQYMGGNRFLTMTGAKDLSYDETSLSFKIPKSFKNGVSHVRIIYNEGLDLFDMKFMYIRGTTYKELKYVSDLYFEDLQKTFTEETGLDTHL